MRRLTVLYIIGLLALWAFPGNADVSEIHVEMRGIPNEACLKCHSVVVSVTGPRAILENPAHGIHLHLVPVCSDCHAQVDLGLAASQPWKSQVEAEVCYQCHPEDEEMVKQVLETAVTVGRGAERFIQTLDTRVNLPTEGSFVGSDRCGGCHEEIYGLWKDGPHARAMTSPILQPDWESDKRAHACLRCHTTGFNPETGEFSAREVGCEVCHGPMVKDHPDAVQGEPQLAASICSNCHLNQWGEWRSSRHAGAGIDCSKCHNPHGQRLLFPTVQELCSACHEERGEVFAHSTHASRELLCWECHMHAPKPGHRTGHTFAVGSDTCIRCHRDEIHAREKIVTLGAEIQELRQNGEEELRRKVQQGTAEIERLKSARTLRLYSGLLQGSLIGLAVGGVGAWIAARRWREEEDEDDTEKEEEDQSPSASA